MMMTKEKMSVEAWKVKREEEWEQEFRWQDLEAGNVERRDICQILEALGPFLS